MGSVNTEHAGKKDCIHGLAQMRFIITHYYLDVIIKMRAQSVGRGVVAVFLVQTSRDFDAVVGGSGGLGRHPF